MPLPPPVMVTISNDRGASKRCASLPPESEGERERARTEPCSYYRKVETGNGLDQKRPRQSPPRVPANGNNRDTKPREDEPRGRRCEVSRPSPPRPQAAPSSPPASRSRDRRSSPPPRPTSPARGRQRSPEAHRHVNLLPHGEWRGMGRACLWSSSLLGGGLVPLRLSGAARALRRQPGAPALPPPNTASHLRIPSPILFTRPAH